MSKKSTNNSRLKLLEAISGLKLHSNCRDQEDLKKV